MDQIKQTGHIVQYPLSWPPGWTRATTKQRSRFKISFEKARDGVMHEIALLGGKDVILSTNIPLKRDGFPYADTRMPLDPGVALYFKHKGKQICLACDKWNLVADNIHAVGLSIAAIRGVARWGASDMMERAFTGFAALPAPASAPRAWHEVLSINPNASLDEIKVARNRLVRKYHPDMGDEPSAEMTARINRAYEEGCKIIKTLGV